MNPLCASGIEDMTEDHRDKADTLMLGTWHCGPCLDRAIELGLFDE